MVDPKPKAEPKAEPKAKKVPGLRVRAQVSGFRRGGRAWNTTPEEVAVSGFSKEQIAQIKAEPLLVVEDVEIEVAAESTRDIVSGAERA